MSRLEELIQKYCPDGVECKKLSEIGNTYSGLSGKSKADFADGNAVFISYMNVYSHLAIDIHTNDRVKIGENEKQNIIQQGDVFFTGSSETPDECAFSSVCVENPTKPMYLNSFCFGYRFNNPQDFLPGFCKYLFSCKEFRKQIPYAVSGVTRFNVSKARFVNLQIPIIPLPIQQEIVRILDSFSSLEQELEQELEQRKEQYSFYRDELLSFESNNSLPVLQTLVQKYCPDGVEYKKLDTICEVYDGTHSTPHYTDKGVKFASVENIKSPFSSKKYISEKDYEKYKIKPRINDVLMTRIGTIGKCYVIDKDEPLAYYVSLALLRPDNTVLNSQYLKYAIESIKGRKELYKRTLIHAVPIKVNKDEIGKIELPIPPLSVQQEIVKILDSFDKYCTDLTSGLPAEIALRKKQYEYYRDRLLSFPRKA